MSALFLTTLLALANGCPPLCATQSTNNPNGTRAYCDHDEETVRVYECKNGAWKHIFDQDKNTGPWDD